MAIYRSDRAIVALRDETTTATGAAWDIDDENYSVDPGGNYTWAGIVQSVETGPPAVEWKEYFTVATDRHMQVRAEGRHTVEGISFPVIVQNGKIFRYLFEGYMYSGTSPYYHRFAGIGDEGNAAGTTGADLLIANVTEGRASLRSCAIEVGYQDPQGSTANFQRKYFGCKATSCEFTTSSDGELLATMSFTGAGYSGTAASATTLSTVTIDRATKPYLFYQATMQDFAHAAAQDWSTSAVTLTRITDWSMTIENDCEAKYYLTTASGNKGGKFAYEIIPKKRTISGTFSIILDDDATKISNKPRWWSRLVDGSTFDVLLKFVRGTNDEIHFKLFDVAVNSAPMSVPEEKGEVAVEIGWTCRKCQIYVITTTSGSYATGI